MICLFQFWYISTRDTESHIWLHSRFKFGSRTAALTTSPQFHHVEICSRCQPSLKYVKNMYYIFSFFFLGQIWRFDNCSCNLSNGKKFSRKKKTRDKLIVEINLPVLQSLFSRLCITSLTPGQLALIAPDMWLCRRKVFSLISSHFSHGPTSNFVLPTLKMSLNLECIS